MKYYLLVGLVSLTAGFFLNDLISPAGEIIKSDTITTTIHHYDTVRLETFTPKIVKVPEYITIVDSFIKYRVDTVEVFRDYFSVNSYDTVITPDDNLTAAFALSISRNQLFNFSFAYNYKETKTEITNTVEKKRNGYYTGISLTTDLEPYALIGFNPKGSKFTYFGSYQPQRKLFGATVIYKVR